jgi:isopenicillin N synthase-like dioxygenase
MEQYHLYFKMTSMDWKLKSIPGTILVVAGNLLQRLTADSITAVVHRVLILEEEK